MNQFELVQFTGFVLYMVFYEFCLCVEFQDLFLTSSCFDPCD
jgi:hypothetical protein